MLQQEYSRDPRAKMAEALRLQGSSTAPVQSIGEGIARMGQGALAGYMQGRVQSDYDARGDAYRNTMAQALQAMNSPGGEYPGAPMPVQPGGVEGAMQILGANADTADLGFQMAMQNLSAQQQMAQAMKLLEAKQAMEPPKFQTIRQGSEDVTYTVAPGGQMQEVGRGAAWNPSTGALTPYQQAQLDLALANGARDAARFAYEFGASPAIPAAPPAAPGAPTEAAPAIPGLPPQAATLPKKMQDELIAGQIKEATKAPTLSPKDINTARGKLQAAGLLKQQIAEAREKFAAIKDSLSAGPGGNYLPTEAGQQFDAAVDALRSTVTALTRTPGVGAMSDYETRLDQSKIPSRGKYESVTAQQLDQLDALADFIASGYQDLLGPAMQAAPPGRDFTIAPAAAPTAQAPAVNVEDLLKKYQP